MHIWAWAWGAFIHFATWAPPGAAPGESLKTTTLCPPLAAKTCFFSGCTGVWMVRKGGASLSAQGGDPVGPLHLEDGVVLGLR